MSAPNSQKLTEEVKRKAIEYNMTPRENMLAAFRRQTTEWVPWVAAVGSPNIPCFVPDNVRSSPDPLAVARYLRRELGCDILIGADVVNQTKTAGKCVTRQEGDDTIEEQYIAGRTLRSVSRKLPFGREFSSSIHEYFIKTPEDMETFCWLLDDTSLELNTAGFEQLTQRLDDEGVVFAYAPRTPIMGLIIDRMGLENFVGALSDYPEQTKILLDRVHEYNLAYYKIVSQSACPVAGVFEDVTTLLVSPAMFRQYVQPCLAAYADILHAAGKIFMLHTCGHMRDFLPLFLQTGIDALHYVTEPPLGDTTMAQAKKIWKDKITIMGAIAPVLLAQGTPEDVERKVTEMFRAMQPDRSFILMSSSKPDIPEANLRHLAQTIKRLQ